MVQQFRTMVILLLGLTSRSHSLGFNPFQNLLSGGQDLSNPILSQKQQESSNNGGTPPGHPGSRRPVQRSGGGGSSLMSMLPAINLKRRPNDPVDYHKNRVKVDVEFVEEVECSESMFMSPFHYPVSFTLNDSVYDRIDKSCRWTIVGTEPCIPSITCVSSTIRECESEFLSITDGSRGVVKVCRGGANAVNHSASDDLRDLYVRFKVVKPPSTTTRTGQTLFNCTVSCSKRGEGVPLPKTYTPRVNPKCYCGTKPNENRIVGGENAKKSEFPWLVALVETNTRQPFCGGSIINNKFILTAGHCIKGKYMDYTNIQVIINGHEFDSSPNQNVIREKVEPRTYPLSELDKLDKGNGSVRVNIEEIIVHPLYVSETNDFDVCLLKLSEPLDLSQKPEVNASYQPPRSICLPELGSYLRTYSNKKAVIAGWGLPDIDAEGTPIILQKLVVNVFSPKVCKEMYAHRVNRRMLCAGHRQGGKDACSGDSGGPLVVQDRPQVWVQVASVSWGEGCAVPDNPGVYFRTSESGQWAHYHSNVNNATWCVVPK